MEEKSVLLIGSLQKTKGLLDFVKLAAMLRASDWQFRVIGTPVWESFQPDEIRQISQAVSGGNNLITHFDPLTREKDFIGHIRRAKVIFCAYRDYPFSSGILNWAARYRRPVLVYRGKLMGHRVEKFGLGLSFPEEKNSLRAMRNALLDFPRGCLWTQLRPRWADYEKLHGSENLMRILFAQLISSSA